jgi:hypothetical protein
MLSNQSTHIIIMAALLYLFLRNCNVEILPTPSEDISSNEIRNKLKLNNHSLLQNVNNTLV